MYCQQWLCSWPTLSADEKANLLCDLWYIQTPRNILHGGQCDCQCHWKHASRTLLEHWSFLQQHWWSCPRFVSPYCCPFPKIPFSYSLTVYNLLSLSLSLSLCPHNEQLSLEIVGSGVQTWKCFSTSGFSNSGAFQIMLVMIVSMQAQELLTRSMQPTCACAMHILRELLWMMGNLKLTHTLEKNFSLWHSLGNSSFPPGCRLCICVSVSHSRLYFSLLLFLFQK